MRVNRVIETSATDLLESLDDRSVGAIITDPPFHISTGRAGSWVERRGMGGDPTTEVSSVDEAIEWTKPVVEQAARVLRLGGALVVMGGTQSLLAWDWAAPRLGLQWMCELIVLWNTGKPRARNFGSLHTRVMWYVKAGLRHEWNSAQRSIYSNVIVCSKVHPRNRTHPSQKPVGLTNLLVSLLTNETDIVVDPFCGSGSTLVSAVQCGRRWLGADIDSRYVEAARNRVALAEDEPVEPIYLWVNGRQEEV